MQKGVLIFAIFMLAMLALLPFQNCAPQGTVRSGTETGNAMGPGNDPNASNPPPAMTNILAEVCARLALCHAGLDPASCESQLASLSGLPQALGASASLGPSTMTQFENQGSVSVVSVNNATTCAAALQALPCSDAGIQGAYNSATGSYSGLIPLLSGTSVCHSIY